MPDMHAVSVHENEFGEISFPSAKKDYLPSHHDKVVFAEKAQKRLQKPFAPYQIGERGGFTSNKTKQAKHKRIRRLAYE